MAFMTNDERAFWQAAYIAAMRSGNGSPLPPYFCKAAADAALENLRTL